MSATGYGCSSAIPGLFQDQWWRAAGESNLSIEKAVFTAQRGLLNFGVVANT
jgi:hypothetical protein